MVQLKKKVTLKAKIPDKGSIEQRGNSRESKSATKSHKRLFMWVFGFLVIVSCIFILRQNSNDSVVSVNIIAEDVDVPKEAVQTVDSPVNNEQNAEDLKEYIKDNEAAVDKTNSAPEHIIANANKEQESSFNDHNSIIGSVEEKALLVIRGKFGNGEARKLSLGSEYKVVQSKVNEMYKEGKVV